MPPEEGDSVSFSVEGKVQSVEGGTATVSIDSINGEPVGAESSEGSEEDEGQPPTPGGGAGAGAGQPPVQASGPADTMGPMGKGMAPRRAANPAASPFPAANLARNRIDRAGTAALRNKLMKGARNSPLQF